MKLANRLMRLAGGGPWTPAQITTALWLDADDASTITLNGSTVSQWADRSGRGRHAAQVTPSYQPLLVSSGLNSKPVLRFDGVSDHMAGTVGLWSGNNDGAMFAVYTPRTTAANTCCSIFGQAPSNTANTWRMLQFRNQYVVGDPYFAGYSNDLTDSSAITTAAKIAGYTYISGVSTLYRNGSFVASGSKTLNSSGAYRIGYDSTNDHGFLNGDVAEIVAISGSISGGDRQKIEGYLAHKWALTAELQVSHPYKTTAP